MVCAKQTDGGRNVEPVVAGLNGNAPRAWNAPHGVRLRGGSRRIGRKQLQRRDQHCGERKPVRKAICLSHLFPFHLLRVGEPLQAQQLRPFSRCFNLERDSVA